MNSILRNNFVQFHSQLFHRVRYTLYTVVSVNIIFFLGVGGGGRRAPQQKLRTHHNLKAYCATLMMKMKRKMISFFIFPSNGAPAK
jgi:hypothetical protein